MGLWRILLRGIRGSFGVGFACGGVLDFACVVVWDAPAAGVTLKSPK